MIVATVHLKYKTNIVSEIKNGKKGAEFHSQLLIQNYSKTCICFCAQLGIHFSTCLFDGWMATQKMCKAMSECVQ